MQTMNCLLFVDNSNQSGILFRLPAKFGSNPGDIVSGSNTNIGLAPVSTGSTQWYFMGEFNPSADELDMWSVSELSGA